MKNVLGAHHTTHFLTMAYTDAFKCNHIPSPPGP